MAPGVTAGGLKLLGSLQGDAKKRKRETAMLTLSSTDSQSQMKRVSAEASRVLRAKRKEIQKVHKNSSRALSNDGCTYATLPQH